jgi:NADH dehydrogenase [ubiquinone] 1 alpha subcomplex assembly factor 7
MSALGEYLKQHISQNGPIDVGQFMGLCLGHPEHGYYMKRDPFGAGGDFTTAPEISQMFGEMIGVWAADTWMKMGSPSHFILLECGPGRGTLMADLLRGTKHVPGFHAACKVHLLEMSPVLKEMQREALKGYEVRWHETLADMPRNHPVIVIANEFLDALPFRQFEKTKEGWRERYVGYSPSRGFHYMYVATPMSFDVDGSVFEISPARVHFLQNINDILKAADGAALFIDYGHAKSAAGDTFQALYKHQYVPVFEHAGDADLTSHVDFEPLKAVSEETGLKVYGPKTQGEFLKALGIEARAIILSEKASEAQRGDIENALRRLIAPDQMGELFKVMGLSHGKSFDLAGF